MSTIPHKELKFSPYKPQKKTLLSAGTVVPSNGESSVSRRCESASSHPLFLVSLSVLAWVSLLPAGSDTVLYRIFFFVLLFLSKDVIYQGFASFSDLLCQSRLS